MEVPTLAAWARSLEGGLRVLCLSQDLSFVLASPAHGRLFSVVGQLRQGGERVFEDFLRPDARPVWQAAIRFFEGEGLDDRNWKAHLGPVHLKDDPRPCQAQVLWAGLGPTSELALVQLDHRPGIRQRPPHLRHLKQPKAIPITRDGRLVLDLTDAEAEVFRLGYIMSNNEIAKRLEVSASTISTHQANIRQKCR